MIFAVRLDTFPQEAETTVFYIGTNDPAELTEIRRHILTHFTELPIEGEYLHRGAFDIAEKYGKDTFLAIQYLGTAWLPTLFAVKGRLDGIAERLGFLPRDLSDKIMQVVSRMFPRHLPRRMRTYRDKYEHHLMLKTAGSGIDDARRFLGSIFPSAQGDFFECKASEGDKAFLHRFAAAGAAIRYRAIHHREVEDIVALDVALRRNDQDWVETLPDDVAKAIIQRLYYGHFFCHVFHQDYIVAKGHDTVELEQQNVETAGCARRAISGRAQCRPSLRGQARARQTLQGPRSLQLLQSRHRADLKAQALERQTGSKPGCDQCVGRVGGEAVTRHFDP